MSMEEMKHFDYKRFLKRYRDYYIDQASPAQSLDQKPFTYNLLDQSEQTFIDIALEQNRVCLNDQALYIKTVTNNKTYQSLIFHTDGTIIKSCESTAVIMQRFFRHKGLPYSTHSQLGKLIKIHQKCPYMVNKICLAPEKGLSKNSVNWIGLHNVVYHTGDKDHTLLKTATYNELVIPLSQKKVDKMVHNSSLLALMHQAIRIYTAGHYGFLDHYPNQENVISHYIQSLRYQTQLPDPRDIYQYMEQQKVIGALKHIMGVDYPTKEEWDLMDPKLQAFFDSLDS